MPRPSSLHHAHRADSIVDDDDLEQSSLTPPPQRRPSFVRLVTPIKFMLDLHTGSPVGEYEIQEQIGEGAMGTVYLAVQPLIGKRVAIKVLKPELCSNQASIDRFVQEAQAVNKIGHPNIVDVFSLGELPDGRAYFVMELLRGEDLKARLARGPITVTDACDILDGIARALHAAHEKDIVHRDLKPDNVFLHQVEAGPRMVKLLDFGIAKLLRSQQQMEKTQTGNMLGTPRYISPEQARGVDVTPRSDIYSLGVMAYEMLAGRAPFEGETAMDLVVKHLSEPPPPLSQFTRVPRALERCVMRMLAKDPAARPTIAEIRQVLADPNRRTLLPAVSPRRWPLIVGGILLAAVAGVATWQIVQGYQPPAQPDDLATITPPPSPVVTPPPRPPVVAREAPAPPPPERGVIDVRVTGPKDATVLVDGVEWGRGAAIKIETEPGGHDVEVRAKGRDPIVQRVDVRAGQVSAVAIVVPMPATDARPAKRTASKKSRPARADKPAPPPPDEDALLRPKHAP